MGRTTIGRPGARPPASSHLLARRAGRAGCKVAKPINKLSRVGAHSRAKVASNLIIMPTGPHPLARCALLEPSDNQTQPGSRQDLGLLGACSPSCVNRAELAIGPTGRRAAWRASPRAPRVVPAAPAAGRVASGAPPSRSRLLGAELERLAGRASHATSRRLAASSSAISSHGPPPAPPADSVSAPRAVERVSSARRTAETFATKPSALRPLAPSRLARMFQQQQVSGSSSGCSSSGGRGG